MFKSFEKYIRESSGWTLQGVESLIVHTVDYTPLTASSFMVLPKEICYVRSLLNIRNLDKKMFSLVLFSFLTSL